jgi:hypothetical protein
MLRQQRRAKMTKARLLFVLLGIFLCMFMVYCGGGSSTSTSPPVTPPAGAVSVAVTPATASVIITQTQQFTASVSNSTNQSVSWSVNGVAGGNASVGTVSAAGLYTAPAALPSPVAVSVTAASVADTTRSADGAVTVTPYSGVLTYHNDNARDGVNASETILTPANVTSAKFGKIFTFTLDGFSLAQPLYLSHVAVGGSFHNVVYVATEHDTVYAFDADGASANPLWSKSFINPAAGVTSTPAADLDSPIQPEIGITSTPVIDGNTGTLYVLVETKESGAYIHRLHALDVTSGAEKFNGPTTIQATVSGTGSAASGGQITFNPFLQLQRSALLLSGGHIFIAWASYNDTGLYHGWVMAYDAATLQQTAVWNDTPNGIQGGIWMANAGLSADGDGNIYVAVGNGSFDANTNGSDYGDSFVKLNLTSGGLVVSDSFTPFNQADLENVDNDLGSSGLVLLPDMNGPVTHLAVSGSKEGRIYLVNLDDLGKYQPGSDSQIVQSIPNALGLPTGRNTSTAVYWQGNVYFTGRGDALKQYKITNGQLALSAQTPAVYGYSTSNSLSANGASDGIVWTLEAGNDILHAFDATNVADMRHDSIRPQW